MNVIGTWNVIRHAVGLMTKNEPDSDGQRGVIINTLSITCFEGHSETTAYASSKDELPVVSQGMVTVLCLPLQDPSSGEHLDPSVRLHPSFFSHYVVQEKLG